MPSRPYRSRAEARGFEPRPVASIEPDYAVEDLWKPPNGADRPRAAEQRSYSSLAGRNVTSPNGALKRSCTRLRLNKRIAPIVGPRVEGRALALSAAAAELHLPPTIDDGCPPGFFFLASLAPIPCRALQVDHRLDPYAHTEFANPRAAGVCRADVPRRPSAAFTDAGRGGALESGESRRGRAAQTLPTQEPGIGKRQAGGP